MRGQLTDRIRWTSEPQIRSKRIRYCLQRSPAHNLKSLSQNDGMVGLVSTTGRHELPRLKLNEVLNGAIEMGGPEQCERS